MALREDPKELKAAESEDNVSPERKDSLSTGPNADLATSSDLPGTIANHANPGSSTVDLGKRRRECVTWPSKKGIIEEKPAEQAEMEPSGSQKRMRPDPAFLSGLMAGIKQADYHGKPKSSPKAASQVKPENTIGKEALAKCLAELKEMAARHGFALTIVVDESNAKQRPEDANARQQSTSRGSLPRSETTPSETTRQDELEPLTVRLSSRDYQKACGQHAIDPSSSSRSTAKAGTIQPAATNRLAGAALSALSGQRSLRQAKAQQPRETASDSLIAYLDTRNDSFLRMAQTSEAKEQAEGALKERSPLTEATALEVDQIDNHDDSAMPGWLSEVEGLKSDRLSRQHSAHRREAPRNSGLINNGNGESSRDAASKNRIEAPGGIKARLSTSNSSLKSPKGRPGLFKAAMNRLGQ